MQLCIDRCRILPKNFQANLMQLFTHLYTKPEMIAGDLDIILSELEKIL